MSESPLLEATEVGKRFGGITALSGVSLTVSPGEAVGLVGPNGAGKTTLFNCLLGILRPENGRITFDGQDLIDLPVHRRARLGIGRTFQRMELFAEMTVREHLLVAERARRGDGRLWKDLLGRGSPRAEEEHEVDAHQFAVRPPDVGVGSAGLGDLLEPAGHPSVSPAQ